MFELKFINYHLCILFMEFITYDNKKPYIFELSKKLSKITLFILCIGLLIWVLIETGSFAAGVINTSTNQWGDLSSGLQITIIIFVILFIISLIGALFRSEGRDFWESFLIFEIIRGLFTFLLELIFS